MVLIVQRLDAGPAHAAPVAAPTPARPPARGLARAAATTPPQAFFVVSAVFHYLGPAFAVLLFARVDVLGVAWLRIATAGARLRRVAPPLAGVRAARPRRPAPDRSRWARCWR